MVPKKIPKIFQEHSKGYSKEQKLRKTKLKVSRNNLNIFFSVLVTRFERKYPENENVLAKINYF